MLIDYDSKSRFLDLLRKVRWKDRVLCPRCGSGEVRPKKTSKRGFHTYFCLSCRRSFKDTTGTFLERSRLKIEEWIVLLSELRKGSSIRHISKVLGRPYNTTYYAVKKVKGDKLATLLLEEFFRKPVEVEREEKKERVRLTVPAKPKVLMLAWEFPPYCIGGMGKVCYELVKALAKLGVDLTLLVPYETNVSLGGVRIISLNLTQVLPSYFSSIFALRSIYHDVFKAVEEYTRKALEIARNLDFDIIHAHDWLTFRAALELKHRYHKPLVVHLHSTELDRGGGLGVNQLIYEIEREAMLQAERVIAVSEYERRVLGYGYHVPLEKVKVVHNALGELPRMELNGRKFKKLVLYLGRVTLQKGVDYFVRAAKLVSEKRNDVLFVVAGDGDMLYQLMELAADLEIADKVAFTGRLSDEEVWQLYSLADVFVLPSVSDPFGLVALEAAACCVPVIASKNVGAIEVLRHCLTTDFWDVRELASKILACLEYDSLREELINNGRRSALARSWEDQARLVLEIYGEVIKAW